MDLGFTVPHILASFATAAMLAFPTLAVTQTLVPDSPVKLIPGGPQTIFAPIAGLADFSNWQLAVVNHSPRSITATITVYALDGSAFAPKQITLAGSETRRLDVKTLLLQEAPESSAGGISINFTGDAMGLGAQIMMSGHNGFGNVDVPVVSDSTYHSNTVD